MIAALIVPSLLFSWPPQDENQAESRFDQVFEELLKRYVAQIDPQKLSTSAINGMLDQLDPYSEYIVKDEKYQLDVLTKGQYEGVGIQLGRQNDSLVVITPMAGSPAEKQGVRPGDIILKIDSVWARSLSFNEAARHVRGPQGKPVTLLIRRYGVTEPLEFTLIRSVIRLEDITYSGLLDNGAGYVRLATFSRYTALHLEQEIRKLGRAGMQTFILDLRGNPGGLLNVALQIADQFLPRNVTILETRGRLPNANKRYTTHREAILPDMPMVVLVNRGSASASEIVAGILQDFDRAIVLGSKSFGKGLVQTIYPITDNATLKVTTAKYYLPSGRLIQKADYRNNLIKEDSLEVDTLGFFTHNGRPMRGGGGITPDVQIAPLLVDRYERQILGKGLFFQFAVKYAADHPNTILPFQASHKTMENFHKWLWENNFHYATDFTRRLDRAITLVDTAVSISDTLLSSLQRVRDLASVMEQQIFDADYERIRMGIEREVSGVIAGNNARFAAGLDDDIVVQEALKLLSHPNQVADILNGTTNVGKNTAY